MSALSANNDSSSRAWWSRSTKNPSSKELRRSSTSEKSHRETPSKSGTKFNTLASAMGFKAKKQHPSLAIQDPPPFIRTVHPTSPPASATVERSYTNRPPSKSISSTIRSRQDSLEPRTPSDGQRDVLPKRQSLLTLSDSDPFASRGISLPPTPNDPNRLSIYSNASIPESLSKGETSMFFNRSSYASSSSNSYSHGELSPLSALGSPTTFESPPRRKVSLQTSQRSLRKKASLLSTEKLQSSAWDSMAETGERLGTVMYKPGSSSITLTENNRHSQPGATPAPRPVMRARGMTDLGASQQPPNFFRNDLVAAKLDKPERRSSPPRVLIREPSVSRIGQPLSAPPAHDLPPPPPFEPHHIDDDDDDSDILILPEVSTGSASSSSLSFASTVSSNLDVLINQPYHPRQKEKRITPDHTFFSSGRALKDWDFPGSSRPTASSSMAQLPSGYPRTLKKAISHQSLSKVSAPPSVPIPSPPPESSVAAGKMRKQRSFNHHPRIPLPPLPLPLRSNNSLTSSGVTSPISDHPSLMEQRRGSSGSGTLSTRKRLFSGGNSRRPSTTQSSATDDSRSIFSLPPDEKLGSAFANALTSTETQSTSWDDPADHMPSTPLASTPEYTPQHIMSPAELLKVEASFMEEETHMRSRGMSFASMSTAASDKDDSATQSLLPSSPRLNVDYSRGFPSRSHSMMAKALSPPRTSLRPSTSQATMTPPTSPHRNTFFSSNSGSPQAVLVSLPPPPRPRKSHSTLPTHVPISSPPPPPPPPIDQPSTPIAPLTPPPKRRILRLKSSADKVKNRKSIMKKPSFLDIGFDTDPEVEDKEEPVSESFLDLARESLDSVQSGDE